jgi:hypothetical protein
LVGTEKNSGDRPIPTLGDQIPLRRKAEIDPKLPFTVDGANVAYWIAKQPSNGRDQLGSCLIAASSLGTAAIRPQSAASA